MIRSKKINIIAAGMLCVALVISGLMLIFAHDERFDGLKLAYQPQYTDEIFGTDMLTLEIRADQEVWDEMIKNAMSEAYISCTVVVNGTVFENVGIRPKGNSSLSQVAMSNSPQRYSFRLKFDKYVANQTCFGLDSFVVNNMSSDATYMKEYLSYDILHYIGVDTPLYNFTDISVNGESFGLYLAIEAYGESYLARTGRAKGNLYNVKSMDMGDNGMTGGAMQMRTSGGAVQNEWLQRDPNGGARQGMPDQNTSGGAIRGFGGEGMSMPEGWPDMSALEQGGWPEMPTQGGMMMNMPTQGGMAIRPDGMGRNGMPGGMGRGTKGGDLKYTGDDISSYGAIFDNAVFKATDELDMKNVITAIKQLSLDSEFENYFEVDEILRYLAGHVISVNLDSYFSSMAQNYYIYENEGKVSILPWDYNLAWGGFQGGSAQSVVNFPIDTPVSGVTVEDRPLVDKLLSVETYQEKYHGYLQEIITGYFDSGRFEQTIDTLHEKIGEYVKKDPTAFVTYEQYEKSLSILKELGLLRAKSIQGQLDGSIPSTTEGQNATPAQLIQASHLDLSVIGGQGGQGRGRGNF